MSSRCTVRIFGTVSRIVVENGARVTVPFGIYNLERLSQDRCRLSGDGLPTFELDVPDVASHMGPRMKVVDGVWP